MHRNLRVLLFLFFITALPVAAQQNFTQYLTRSKAGEGVVILHQDAEIEALVNGTSSHSPVPAVPASRQHEGTPSLSHVTDSLSPATNPSSLEGTSVLGRRMRATGYRIQVYAGGNNRQSKAEAYRMADLVRSTFIDANLPAGPVASVTSRHVRRRRKCCSVCAKPRSSVRLLSLKARLLSFTDQAFIIIRS